MASVSDIWLHFEVIEAFVKKNVKHVNQQTD